MKYLTILAVGFLLSLGAVRASLITSNPFGTVGNDLVDRARIDGTNGGVFVMVEQSNPVPFTSAAFPEEGTVASWSFVGNPTGGSYITPFIVQRFGATPSYIVHGIGATQQDSGAPGVQTFPFDLQSGSNYVLDDGNYFLGWYDGRLDVANVGAFTQNGVVEYDSNIPTEGGRVLYFGGAGYELMSDRPPYNSGVNRDLSTRRNQPSTLFRVYSITATVIPEPGSIGLFALGMVFLASCRRCFHAG